MKAEKECFKLRDEIRSSKEILEKIFDSSPDTLFLFDLKGTFIDSSRSAEGLTGYRREELIGKSFLKIGLVKKKDIPKAAAGIARNALGKPTGPDEYILNRKDGGQTTIEVMAYPIKIKGNAVVLGIARNITERRKSEEALLESENRFRKVTENCHEWIWEVDANGLYTYSSTAAEKIIGYKPEEIVGKKHFYDFFPPNENEKLKKAAFEEFSNKKPFRNFINSNVHKNGNIVILQTSGTPVLNSKRELLGYVGTDIDVSESKRMEEALRDSENRLNEIIQGSPIPQFIIDKDHKVIAWNRALEEYSGIKAEEVLNTGNHWKAFYKSKRPCMADLILEGSFRDLRKLYGDNCAKSKYTKGAYEATSFFPEMKEGGTWLHFTATAIKDKEGKPTCALETLEDITERRKAEQDIKQSEEMYRILYESSWDAIMTLAPPSWKFTSGNPATLRLFNAKSEKEFITKGPWDVSPERQPDGTPSSGKAKMMIEKAMKEGSNLFEWTHKKLSGEDFPATVLLTRMNFKGKTFLQATVRDISEQKKAEEDTRKRNDELEKFNKLSVGRELKMIELKKRIAELENKTNAGEGK